MLKHVSIIITLATATLYTLGITYYQSYLRRLGVEETLFPLTIDRTIFQGFVSSITMGAKAFVWFYAAALGVFVTALIGNLLIESIKKHTISTFIFKRYRKNSATNSSDLNEFTVFAVNVVEYGSVLLIIFLGFLLVLLASDKAGSESAKNFIKKCDTGKLKSHLVAVGSGNPQISGYPIVCNPDLCAYFLKGKSVVIGKDGRVVSEVDIEP